ncbi:leishmanolysin-related zinc metalloendopeptidase [Ruegeria arenilitoris]|uniref:leishmanolysin-related zinc metalloendopeptidase n=1 Tax=Ruegeria arenilitoris TaxID=1173585 RepID=UPI00147D0C94|nr:leishmanolysin-related zinc metalloendopeptidase [Ruegeria arenilitoris]
MFRNSVFAPFFRETANFEDLFAEIPPEYAPATGLAERLSSKPLNIATLSSDESVPSVTGGDESEPHDHNDHESFEFGHAGTSASGKVIAPVFAEIASLEISIANILPELPPAKGLSEGLSNKPLNFETLSSDEFVFAVATGNDNELHDHNDEHDHEGFEVGHNGVLASGKVIASNGKVFDNGELAFQRPDGVGGGGGPFGGGGTGDDTDDSGTGDDTSPGYGTNDLFAEYVSGTADADGVDHFNVEIEFYGDWTGYEAYMDAFALSAEFISSIMTQGLWDDPQSFNTFDPTGVNMFTVDDVLIEARLTDIDGVGNILGGANVYSAREASAPDAYTAVVGLMEFDTSDAQALSVNGTWDDVVLHEMFHALGFGTLWDNYYPEIISQSSTQIAGQDTRRPNDDVYETTAVYNGVAGNAEYISETWTDGDQIIVETDGGSGTALAHWDEDAHFDELMTGYLDTENGAYLADWSIAALADIGYYVDQDALLGDNANYLSQDIDLLDTQVVADNAYILYNEDGTLIA